MNGDAPQTTKPKSTYSIGPVSGVTYLNQPLCASCCCDLPVNQMIVEHFIDPDGDPATDERCIDCHNKMIAKWGV